MISGKELQLRPLKPHQSPVVEECEDGRSHKVRVVCGRTLAWFNDPETSRSDANDDRNRLIYIQSVAHVVKGQWVLNA